MRRMRDVSITFQRKRTLDMETESALVLQREMLRCIDDGTSEMNDRRRGQPATAPAPQITESISHN